MNDFPTTTTRPNEPPMPEPLAYYLTWTTYGTWLPGDERGWVWRGKVSAARPQRQPGPGNA